MKAIEISPAAEGQLEAIYAYSFEMWGREQADAYLGSLIASFSQIAADLIASRPIPGDFGLIGSYHRVARHFVYWRSVDSQTIRIVAILHERMHQAERLRAEWT